MGKNKKIRQKIRSLEQQIIIHRDKQKKIGKGDAPWIKEYWEKEINNQSRQKERVKSKLPGRVQQKHKLLVKKKP